MVNDICFIFKSWPASRCGAVRPGLHGPAWPGSWAVVCASRPSVPSPSRQTGCSPGSRPWAGFALGCCVQRPGELWLWVGGQCELDLALPSHLKPHDGFCEKNTPCFYYTCNFPVLYLERKLLTLSRPFRETFLKKCRYCFELVQNADLLSAAASCPESRAWSRRPVPALCLSFTWCQDSDARSVPAMAALLGPQLGRALAGLPAL